MKDEGEEWMCGKRFGTRRFFCPFEPTTFCSTIPLPHNKKKFSGL